jgi:L-threonine-O-3-phosphate decarboxylase
MTAPSPRPELVGLGRTPHGSVSEAELARYGLQLSDVVDFSASCNPLGPSTRVRAALESVDPARYPDDEAADLRRGLARRASLPISQVVVGNGSVELIWLVCLAYLRPGDRALVVGPAFGDYARAVRVHGGQVVAVDATEDDGFAPPLDAASEAVEREGCRLAFVGSPNNPTGSYLTREQLSGLLARHPETLFVVDEAYRAFVDSPWPSEGLASRPNALLLRSLTKDYALAGLRLGYALAAPETVDALRSVQPPWSVSAAAQAAGLAALSDEEHLAASREEVRAAKRELVASLSSLGYRVLPGAANAVLVEVADGRAFRAALLPRGVVVRDCASFGLPRHIRIGVRTRPECRRLVEAVADVGRHWGMLDDR